MLAPEEKPKLSTKPYLAATPQFKSGSSSPREFLERCLVDLTALEPKIGAFVHLNIQAARNAADASSARWRAGCPALADRWHADRHHNRALYAELAGEWRAASAA